MSLVDEGTVTSIKLQLMQLEMSVRSVCMYVGGGGLRLPKATKP